MSIKRYSVGLYDPQNGIAPYPVMIESSVGGYVKLEDFEAEADRKEFAALSSCKTQQAIIDRLESENARLEIMAGEGKDALDRERAETARLKKEIDGLCHARATLRCEVEDMKNQRDNTDEELKRVSDELTTMRHNHDWLQATINRHYQSYGYEKQHLLRELLENHFECKFDLNEGSAVE